MEQDPGEHVAGEPSRESRTGWQVLSGIWVILWGPFLFASGTPVFRDLLLTYLPARAYWAERLREGQLPQWFPFDGLGEPFIGQGIEGTFHPFNLVYLLLAPGAGLRAEIAFDYGWGLCGQYLLGRVLGLRPVAAVCGALTLALSGYALSLSCNPPYLRGLCTLPWLAWATCRLAASARPGFWAGLLGILWALIFLGGDAESTALGAVVIAATGVAVHGERRWAWLIPAGGVALLLMGPELGPAWELRLQSGIAHYRNSAFLGQFWSLHPERWLEVVLPSFTPTDVAGALASIRHEPGRWSASVLMGVLPLALVVLARPLDRKAATFIAVGLLGFWLATGTAGGLELLLRSAAPALNALRYPEKHLALCVFGFSTASAMGVERGLLDGRRSAIRLTGVGMAALGATALFFALGFDSLPGFRQLAEPLQLAWRSAAWGAIGRAGLCLALGAAALALTARRGAAAWLLPVIILASLWDPPLGMALVPSEAIRRSALASAARQASADSSMPRVVAEVTTTPIPRDAEEVSTWALAAEKQLLPDTGALLGVATFSDSINLPMEAMVFRQALGFDLVRARPVAALYGFGLAIRSAADPGLTGASADEVGAAEVVARDGDSVLVRQRQLPRAYAAEPRWTTSPREALDLLHANPAAAAVHPLLVGTGRPPAEDTPIGRVAIVGDRPEEVSLRAQLERPGVVVLNDLASPGWTATVDGLAVPILPANSLARSVEVAAGEHAVVFRYSEPGLRPGLLLGLLGLVAAAGLMLIPSRARGVSQPTGERSRVADSPTMHTVG